MNPDRATSELYAPEPEVRGLKSLSVNSEQLSTQTYKGYAFIRRTSKPGDRIELEIPMEVQKVTADERVEANRGRVYYPNAMNKINKPDISLGGDGNSCFCDEFISAVAELYITIGSKAYYSSVQMMSDNLVPLPSFGIVRLLGYYLLARFRTK